MTDSIDALILELLEALAPRALPYAEVMSAWRTSCPRLPVWEEATARGFIERRSDTGGAVVSLTTAGRDFLERHRGSERQDRRKCAKRGSDASMRVRAAADGEEVVCHVNDQDWLLSWHGPGSAPAGEGHGAAAICMAQTDQVVLISADGTRWDLPAGRSEGAETWEQTLRREVLEEACATVGAARLLGFVRGHCIRGHEQGLVLVRSMWLAEVILESWAPAFEITHRKLVPVGQLLAHLTIEQGYLPIYRRALDEAGIA